MPYPPSLNSLYGIRKGGKGIYMSKKGHKYKEEVYYLLFNNRPEKPFDSYHICQYIYTLNLSHRRDADNLQKILFDSLVFSKILLDDSMKYNKSCYTQYMGNSTNPYIDIIVSTSPLFAPIF